MGLSQSTGKTAVGCICDTDWYIPIPRLDKKIAAAGCHTLGRNVLGSRGCEAGGGREAWGMASPARATHEFFTHKKIFRFPPHPQVYR